jgi:hypothetical protein
VDAVNDDVAVEMLTASVEAGSDAAAGFFAPSRASAAPSRLCSLMMFVGKKESLNYSIERLELPCYRSSWEAELPSKQRMSLLFGWRLSPPQFPL